MSLILDLTNWELAMIASKFFVYIGVAASVGGPASVWLLGESDISIQPLRVYVLSAAILGFTASILGFYLQVGFLAEEGFPGMFNDLYQGILWSSSVGHSTYVRSAGFAMVVVTVLIATHGRSAAKTFVGASRNLLAASTYLLGCAALLYSFTPVGHTAVLHWTWCLTLALHLLLIAWWLGSLWPLLLSCSLLRSDQLHPVMHKFGQIASVLVLLLIACGSAVAFQLFNSPSELISTNYGRAFLTKLLLVLGILLLALRHKVQLVPALIAGSERSAARLGKSIKLEMVIGIGILLVTAFLTTAVGPEHGM
jgi:copper resistance protein D